jgi:hypothetical protein
VDLARRTPSSRTATHSDLRRRLAGRDERRHPPQRGLLGREHAGRRAALRPLTAGPVVGGVERGEASRLVSPGRLVSSSTIASGPRVDHRAADRLWVQRVGDERLRARAAQRVRAVMVTGQPTT